MISPCAGGPKEESRIICMRMLRTPPFFPSKSGKNHIWKYFQICLVARFVNNGGRFVKSLDSTKVLLEAVANFFKQYGLAFSLRSEQLDAIYAFVTGKDVFVKAATGFGKSVCFITILFVCDYLYRSKTEAFPNPSFSSVVLVIRPLYTSY